MKKIVVISAKGGVGKSTLTINIARMLKDSGHNVGVLDVDIETPNIPEFLNIPDRDIELSEEGITPKTVDGIEVMSVGFTADTNFAIMWDGGRRAMAIEQLINKVDWTCDVLVIDTPPGTTDDVMTVISKFEPDGIIIVTTNHRASVADVKRTLAMVKILNSSKKVIGIIKNMTYICCSQCGNNIELFSDGKDKEIEKLTIAEIPYMQDGESMDENLLPAIKEIEKVL